ncbi:hypothetical protein ASPZODRAFT_138786 [Penicilliopsis zonata CBS 506.65]|uniref:Zn(2)-C6 fungal-type domain-containing protein n=1 Tax=Penicilliopsis zonata CBS 506.65 TaxID=1073090 RepID=A0A1L9SX34_9EURO|nr:hypothetical protein ASPZODRAFT_138786 [Penicilliopsis zonata CBS 506.65]OJJ51716.1 hypothetical protein ASPZODRAFT_138786 [Penicilliopsis zonata CBS 506.65]
MSETLAPGVPTTGVAITPALYSRPAHSHSCTICQRRKVKCDRQEPCSNCARAGSECIYRAPRPPRRRRRKVTAEEILGSRLRRYEEILKQNGIDPSVYSRSDAPASGGSDLSIRTAETLAADDSQERLTTRTDDQSSTGRLIAKDGKSVYLDNHLWASVSNELQDEKDVLQELSDAESDEFGQSDSEVGPDASSLLFDPPSRRSLILLHPNPVHVFRFWQTFLENVHPLTKIVHAPSIQQHILEAAGDPSKIGRDLEALMFSIYCISLISLQDDEVRQSFGEPRSTLLARYRRGAELALQNAGILRTSNLMVLQAFMLYLLSMRSLIDPHTVWSLTGIAVRISQRIGLHKDGSNIGLSVFETELRRRMWHQMLIIDATAARQSGSGHVMFIPAANTKAPLNVNDSDLDPHMTEPPREHSGLTEMVFCLTRIQFGEWLRQQPQGSGFDGHWSFLASPNISLAQKDEAIDKLEAMLEEKIVNHCDPAIPLHFISTVLARSVVSIMRLNAHHPRRYQGTGNMIAPEERDKIFLVCLQVAEYAILVHTTPSTKRYSWHADNHTPWDALLFILSELRHRFQGKEVEKAWSLIDANCVRQYQQMIGPWAKHPLHIAVRRLILHTWKAHIDECAKINIAPVPRPQIIPILLEQQTRTSQTGSAAAYTLNVPLAPVYPAAAAPVLDDPVLVEGQGIQYSPGAMADLDHLDLSLIDGVSDFRDSPMDWDQWDNLVQQFHQYTNESFEY